MYFEDFLWCNHARNNGLLNYYFPSSTIIHFGGASFDSKIKRSDLYNKSATDFFNFVIPEKKRKFLNFIKVDLKW
jgi:GT2 family glycosyltransferase